MIMYKTSTAMNEENRQALSFLQFNQEIVWAAYPSQKKAKIILNYYLDKIVSRTLGNNEMLKHNSSKTE